MELADILNRFFEGVVEVKVDEERLELTKGSETLILTKPKVIGAQNEPRETCPICHGGGKLPTGYPMTDLKPENWKICPICGGKGDIAKGNSAYAKEGK